MSNAARSRCFASSSSSGVAPGNVSEVSEEAPARADDDVLRTALPAFVAAAPTSPAFFATALARAASAAASLAALTPASLAWSMAACSLAGSALENIIGSAPLSFCSACRSASASRSALGVLRCTSRSAASASATSWRVTPVCLASAMASVSRAG